MKGFFSTLVAGVFILMLVSGGYFALKNLKSPSSYVTANNETIGDLHQLSTNPETGQNTGSSTASTAPATSASIATKVAAVQTANVASSATPVISKSASPNTSASLSANIAALENSGTSLQVGSTGASVGYIEQFVNLYFKTSTSIDNVFGKGLQQKIVTFQKQNKLSQTGIADKETLQMMVLWLSNNAS